MTDDERETVRNKERGCGFLKPGKAYLRSPAQSADGVLSPFVEFDPYIPYLERSKFRGYEYFPGTEFELAVTNADDVPRLFGEWVTPNPDEERQTETTVHRLFQNLPVSGHGLTSTDPPGEIWRHISRVLGYGETHEHAGTVPQFQTRDLFMHVGKSYYETPDEFIEEVYEQGLSKAIPVTESQEPPRIEKGLTRLYLVHPRAVYYEESDSYKPGIIGYVYLSRTIYTEDEKGRFPAWAEDHASGREDMELVHVGEQVYEGGTRATRVDEDEAFGPDEDDGSDGESESEPDEESDSPASDPVSVQPSDKPGRDVEEVPSGLDGDAIREQLDEAADEIREFAESTVEFEEGVYGDVKFVEVPRPDECPDCGELVQREEAEGLGTVSYCPNCGWDNSKDLNAALVEHDLRNDNSYQELRTLVSEKDLNPGQNPSTDDLVEELLRDMGLI